VAAETARIDVVNPLPLALDRDDAVWQTLFQQYKGALRCTAERGLPRSVRGSTDGEDVVQDVFLRMFGRLSRVEFAHAGAVYAYLRRAVIHQVLDEVRKCARRPASLPMTSEIASDVGSPLEEAIDHEEGTLYRDALEQLPSRDRTVLELRLENGLSYKDIALRLGMASPDAARMSAFRAMRRLKSLLQMPSISRRTVGCSRTAANASGQSAVPSPHA